MDCLITTLKGTADNSALLKLGEGILHIIREFEDGDELLQVRPADGETIHITAVGCKISIDDNAYSGSASWSDAAKKIKFSNYTEGCYLRIDCKYKMRYFRALFSKPFFKASEFFSFQMYSPYSTIIGSLGAVSNDTDIDISKFTASDVLYELYTTNAESLYGDLGSLFPLQNIQYIDIRRSPRIEVTYAKIAENPKILNLTIFGYDDNMYPNITGNVSDLFTSTILKRVVLANRNNPITWSSASAKPTTTRVWAGDFNFQSAADGDRFLQNMAACQAVSSTDASFLKIQIFSGRTSASDSAVATLTANGYNVVCDVVP